MVHVISINNWMWKSHYSCPHLEPKEYWNNYIVFKYSWAGQYMFCAWLVPDIDASFYTVLLTPDIGTGHCTANSMNTEFDIYACKY
jgi:hypothetical protein